MRQVIVGTFPMCSEYCELVLREDKGGEFYCMPEEGHVPRIKVGADYSAWGDVVEVILHEVMEFALARLKCRFEAADDFGMDLHGYLFIAQHKEFSDACARAAEFLVAALPAAKKAYQEWKAESRAIADKARKAKKRTRCKR